MAAICAVECIDSSARRGGMASPRCGEPVAPDAAVQREGDPVYIRYERIALEDSPHGATVRY